jgi:hypothetical protein
VDGHESVAAEQSIDSIPAAPNPDLAPTRGLVFGALLEKQKRGYAEGVVLPLDKYLRGGTLIFLTFFVIFRLFSLGIVPSNCPS